MILGLCYQEPQYQELYYQDQNQGVPRSVLSGNISGSKPRNTRITKEIKYYQDQELNQLQRRRRNIDDEERGPRSKGIERVIGQRTNESEGDEGSKRTSSKGNDKAKDKDKDKAKDKDKDKAKDQQKHNITSEVKTTRRQSMLKIPTTVQFKNL